MIDISLITELARLHERGDSYSQISIKTGKARSTIRDWIKKLSRLKLIYTILKYMKPNQIFKALSTMRHPDDEGNPPWAELCDGDLSAVFDTKMPMRTLDKFRSNPKDHLRI